MKYKMILYKGWPTAIKTDKRKLLLLSYMLAVTSSMPASELCATYQNWEENGQKLSRLF